MLTPTCCADRLGPHAAAIDHILAGDRALVGLDPGHAAVLGQHARDLGVLVDLHPAFARAARQRHGHVGGIALAVLRIVDRADHVIDVEQRPLLLHFLRRDRLGDDIEPAQHRRAAQEFLPALLVGRDGERARLHEARRLPRLLLQVGVEIDRVFREPRQVGGVERRAHQPRRMPGRAAGQLLALQQDHVLPAELGQVIGDGAAGDPAADDDDPRLRWKCHALVPHYLRNFSS